MTRIRLSVSGWVRPVASSVAVLALCSGMSLGCGDKKDDMHKEVGTLSDTPRPAWVNKGSGNYPDKKGVIFATGLSPQGMDDEGLAREAADNDARVQLQRVFETYVAAMMETYKRATMQSGKGKTEIDIKSVARTLTEGTLRGSMIQEHWQDPKKGTIYSLCVIDVNAFKEVAAQAKELDSGVKEYIRDNAEKAQDDLDKALGAKNQ